MTVLTLYRVPRRMFRKLAKPAALWLNAWRMQQSMFELGRFISVGNFAAVGRESRRQVQLMRQRSQINGW